jgi:hypothetical protein
MATGDRKFTRIPPESTGDRIQVHHAYTIPYNNKVGDFYIGDIVTGTTSTISGTITAIKESSGTAGIIWIHPLDSSDDKDTVSGENLQVNAVTIATANGIGYPLFTNTSTTVGWNNSQNGQFVDNQGQAYVRYKDGTMEFDSFGRARVSQLNTLGTYVFNYDILPTQWVGQATGSATATHDATKGALLLTNTTGGTDNVKYTTDLYHPYTPGVGQYIEMAVACGDAGKANLERRWGYFDDNNGLYFKQTATGFSFVVRSNTSGGVVETEIQQTDFNLDHVDGMIDENNLSGFELDTSKDVVYWISFQWLGAGNVSFGCFGNGQRVTMHRISNSGVNTESYMRIGGLPIRVEQTNTTTTGSTSEMRLFCCQCSMEGINKPFPPIFVGKSFSQFSVTDAETYLFSVRPAATISSKTNRKIYMLGRLKHTIVKSTDADIDDRIILRVYLNATLTGASWAAINSSGLEADSSASLGAHSILVSEWYLKGTDSVDLSAIANISNNTKILLRADGTQNTYSFVAVHPTSGRTALTYIRPEFAEVGY